MVTLSTLDFTTGLFSLFVIIVGAVIGLTIASKYFKYKSKIYMYWGMAYIGIYSPWWPSAISFLAVVITGEPISLFMYLLIGNLLVPIFLLLWILGFTEMVYQKKRKILLIIYSTICAVAEIILIFVLMTGTYTLLATLTGIFDVTYNRLWLAYLLLVNFTVAITGLLFARDSLRSDDREIRFKGKALIIAFLTYPICAVIDGGLELNAIGVILIRSLLMFGAVMFYIGFFVPKFFKKRFKLE